jgi:hypothetical protein
MKSDTSKRLEDYVAAVMKQGARLSAAAKQFPRTPEGIAEQAAAIQEEVQQRGNWN